ncbi:hypothetical protein NHH63_21300 [Xanthomonas campestris pv. campestris]|uniref:hypothetical protein n=1 Tax=Xanthomonas campestris TaxID=339 RepID=UPI00265C3206|nr:hypothetical protein [Xanthomonas campestris]MDO0840247.1 hypothetical protein [Xanthomonas campestris pv. campestris]
MDKQDAAAMAEMMATLNASNASLQETVKVLTTLVASMQQREQRLRDVVTEQLQVLQNACRLPTIQCQPKLEVCG